MLPLIVQLATIASVLVTAFTIWHNGKANRRQMNAQLFTTYSARYEAIMSTFPNTAFRVRLNSNTALPPESEELTICILKYLNLSSEEFYLWQSKYIDDAVWKIWQYEIQRTLACPLTLREWPKIQDEFTSYPEFLAFVKEAQKDVLPASGFTPQLATVHVTNTAESLQHQTTLHS
jgi:hypothetical protein